MTLNSAKGLFDLRYEILLFNFISYNYNVHRPYYLIYLVAVEAAKIWICARENSFVLYWIISIQCCQILVKINNSNIETSYYKQYVNIPIKS
jgi:hypothetical protein